MKVEKINEYVEKITADEGMELKRISRDNLCGFEFWGGFEYYDKDGNLLSEPILVDSKDFTEVPYIERKDEVINNESNSTNNI